MAENEVVSLREHFEGLLAAQDKAVHIAMQASEKAVLKAEAAAEKRYEALNEMREMLNTNVATLMSRDAADERFRAISKELVALAGRIDRMEGAGHGVKTSWLVLLGLIGAIGTVIAILARP